MPRPALRPAPWSTKSTLVSLTHYAVCHVPDRHRACASSPGLLYADTLWAVCRIVADAASYQNHNCLPNCEFIERTQASRHVPAVYVRAKKGIKAGKQLTISYGSDTTRKLTQKCEGLHCLCCICSSKNCCGSVFA
jgi:hypothetical protein